MRVQAGQPKPCCSACAAKSRGVGEVTPCGDIPTGCICTEDGHVACYSDATDPSAGPFALGGDAIPTAGSSLAPKGAASDASPPPPIAPFAGTPSGGGTKTSGVTITSAGCDSISRTTMLGGALVGVVAGVFVGALVGYFAAR